MSNVISTNNFKDLDVKTQYETLLQKDRNLIERHGTLNTPFYDKMMSKEEMKRTNPYNPANGQPFSDIEEMKMRMHKDIHGFKEAKYIPEEHAIRMGLELKPLRNKQSGEIIRDENGKAQYPEGINSYRINHKGELSITKFYNVEQLDLSGQNRAFKEMDFTLKAEMQKSQANTPASNRINADLSDLQLLPKTKENLEAFINAGNTGMEHTPKHTMAYGRDGAWTAQQSLRQEQTKSTYLGR